MPECLTCGGEVSNEPCLMEDYNADHLKNFVFDERVHFLAGGIERKPAQSREPNIVIKGRIMAKIPYEVQEFVKGKMAWVATASPDGVPNATPKGTVRVMDDEHIVFADLFSLKTRSNLENNPKVAVTVVDLEKYKGYQFKGSTQLVDSGPVFDEMVEQLKKAPMQLPHPKYVVIITVDSIFDQSVGPQAGRQIG